MAKNGLWRLGVVALVAIGAVTSLVDYLNRPKPPDSIIQRIHLPGGLASICGVDKNGMMVHMRIAVYDSNGNFLRNGASDTYACVAVPDMKPGDYWVRLFK